MVATLAIGGAILKGAKVAKVATVAVKGAKVAKGAKAAAGAGKAATGATKAATGAAKATTGASKAVAAVGKGKTGKLLMGGMVAKSLLGGAADFVGTAATVAVSAVKGLYYGAKIVGMGLKAIGKGVRGLFRFGRRRAQGLKRGARRVAIAGAGAALMMRKKPKAAAKLTGARNDAEARKINSTIQANSGQPQVIHHHHYYNTPGAPQGGAKPQPPNTTPPSGDMPPSSILSGEPSKPKQGTRQGTGVKPVTTQAAQKKTPAPTVKPMAASSILADYAAGRDSAASRPKPEVAPRPPNPPPRQEEVKPTPVAEEQKPRAADSLPPEDNVQEQRRVRGRRGTGEQA